MPFAGVSVREDIEHHASQVLIVGILYIYLPHYAEAPFYPTDSHTLTASVFENIDINDIGISVSNSKPPDGTKLQQGTGAECI